MGSRGLRQVGRKGSSRAGWLAVAERSTLTAAAAAAQGSLARHGSVWQAERRQALTRTHAPWSDRRDGRCAVGPGSPAARLPSAVWEHSRRSRCRLQSAHPDPQAPPLRFTAHAPGGGLAGRTPLQKPS